MLSIDERYNLFKKTITQCGSKILLLTDDEYKHILFEELPIDVYSFLHSNTLNELYEDGFIDEKTLNKSSELRRMFLEEEQYMRDITDVKKIKGYAGFLNIINLADEIIDLIY